MTSFSGQRSLLGSWGQRGIRKDKRKWRGEPQKGDGIFALEEDKEAEEAQIVTRKHTGSRSVYTDSNTCVAVGRNQDSSGSGHSLVTSAHTAQRTSLCPLPEAPPLSQEAGSGKEGKTRVRTCHSVGSLFPGLGMVGAPSSFRALSLITPRNSELLHLPPLGDRLLKGIQQTLKLCPAQTRYLINAE